MTKDTVNDLTTDHQILLARLIESGLYASDPRFVREVFTELGIEAHLPPLDRPAVADGAVPEAEGIDVDAVIAQWGGYGIDYPPAGSEEIEQFRRRLVTTALTLGEAHGVFMSSAVEHALRTVGLSAYLPPTSKPVVVELGIDQLTIEARLTPSGEIDQAELTRAILGRLRADLENRSPLPTVDAVPTSQS
ncbi:hypothetical protein [Nocardia sp. NPDC050710]|uniref:hypothetical protein n=1 Tax=Nocardia sp. NPDC050710 TaxID=3157220 RepID=UPI00340C40E6